MRVTCIFHFVVSHIEWIDTFYKITPDLETFAEYFSQFEPSEIPRHNIGGGLTYAHGKHLAIYIGAGHTILYSEYNYFITGGAVLKMRS